MGLTLPIVAAMLAVYVLWGGTYLAMKFAIDTMPPLLMAGTRFLTAGVIMYIWQMASGAERPQLEHWRGSAMVGGLLLLGGNGAVVMAEQYVTSGIAAIIVATVPLWMALLAWLWQGGKRPNSLVLTGLALGFAGILLLVKNSTTGAPESGSQFIGNVMLMGASLSWAAGSLYSRVAKQVREPFLAIAMQMIAGGAMCFAAGLLTGEWSRLSMEEISLRSALSLGYLIGFGSIIGFSAYIWLLKVADPTMVSTYAYVNPVVAVILGWALAGEQMTVRDGLAAAVIVLAVVLITRANSRKNNPVEEPGILSPVEGEDA